MESDPLANLYNMAALPYMFGPNKYSDYNNAPLSLPGYAGTPTDAMGKPIQSFLDAQKQHDAWQPTPAPAPAPGTTLNTSPGAGYFQTPAGSQALGAQVAPPGSNPGTQALYGRNFAAFAPVAGRPLPPGSMYGAAGGGQAAAPAPAQTNPVDMRQAYLSALANPGPVTTPGANVPQAPSAMPNVLDSFLANNARPQAPGAGGYSNAGFFNTLRGLRAAT